LSASSPLYPPPLFFCPTRGLVIKIFNKKKFTFRLPEEGEGGKSLVIKLFQAVYFIRHFYIVVVFKIHWDHISIYHICQGALYNILYNRRYPSHGQLGLMVTKVKVYAPWCVQRCQTKENISPAPIPLSAETSLYFIIFEGKRSGSLFLQYICFSPNVNKKRGMPFHFIFLKL
jgi:hypothetical protein